MKGRNMTTSLMLAAFAGRKTVQRINIAETQAITAEHQVIWSKVTDSIKRLIERNTGRDELKTA